MKMERYSVKKRQMMAAIPAMFQGNSPRAGRRRFLAKPLALRGGWRRPNMKTPWPVVISVAVGESDGVNSEVAQ